ncbi:hypothetical protein NE236_16055 [Actinoallomurus purpureus]|uniref:hypothetical protein n=1 Tax=Actinoallomurus purpureus TaxID=478114 RepID=UPI002092E2FF|nr:hypothetical protein [Actinoallomurus purpureus]MCO6006500.1 hypothetical protein [Actinoallomurus purpureus]
MASGRSLEGAGSGESLAAGSRGVTAGFADGDDVPVPSAADVGEPAADRAGVTAPLVPPVRGDAGVVGGHQAVAAGDRQGWSV